MDIYGKKVSNDLSSSSLFLKWFVDFATLVVHGWQKLTLWI